ncbi:MAG: imidazole glycerol phosphate synthase subunit HisH [Actinobacteria bacterium]|nr:imidazole glycerol phosphate synthase subunit HisH [Actinomycetota bacterium]
MAATRTTWWRRSSRPLRGRSPRRVTVTAALTRSRPPKACCEVTVGAPSHVPPRVAVVDYGMGNLASVAKALARSGADVRVTQSAAEVRGAAGVVLPGVGAFGDAAARLEQTGLGAVVLERIAAGTPFLGVCLGLQLLFESSSEGGRRPGLGVLGGTVELLPTDLKVPHIGWNDLEWGPAGAGMARGLPAPAIVYFVHSYAALPTDPAVVAATTDYGGRVVAAVARDNVWAVQFHPEKSSAVGLQLLGNFVATIRQEAGLS